MSPERPVGLCGPLRGQGFFSPWCWCWCADGSRLGSGSHTLKRRTNAPGCTWENVAGGGKKLFDSADELIQEWTPAEWAAEGAALEGAAVEIGNTNTVSGLEGGRMNPYVAEDIGDSGYIDGQEVIMKARSEGTDLEPDVAEGLDLLGEEGGSIPVGVGASALGVVGLGAGAFTLGLFIGHEIDPLLVQLFGFPGYETSVDEEKATEKGCSLVHHVETWHDGAFDREHAPGYYVECNGTERAGELKTCTWIGRDEGEIAEHCKGSFEDKIAGAHEIRNSYTKGKVTAGLDPARKSYISRTSGSRRNAKRYPNPFQRRQVFAFRRVSLHRPRPRRVTK